jgi:hypothetical protein
MEIKKSLQVPLEDTIRVSVYAPLAVFSRIHPDPFPTSPFEESKGDNPVCVELVRKISACLFTPTLATSMMSDSIRFHGYLSLDKYALEDELLIDGQPIDIPTDGIHIIFDHQVSSDDEDPDVVHLWVDEELNVTGRKTHKTDRGRTNDLVKCINQSRKSKKVHFE